MELHLLVLREMKNIFLARQISARRGHGFHTRPWKVQCMQFNQLRPINTIQNQLVVNYQYIHPFC